MRQLPSAPSFYVHFHVGLTGRVERKIYCIQVRDMSRDEHRCECEARDNTLVKILRVGTDTTTTDMLREIGRFRKCAVRDCNLACYGQTQRIYVKAYRSQKVHLNGLYPL